jgi:hypothetical protein
VGNEPGRQSSLRFCLGRVCSVFQVPCWSTHRKDKKYHKAANPNRLPTNPMGLMNTIPMEAAVRASASQNYSHAVAAVQAVPCVVPELHALARPQDLEPSRRSLADGPQGSGGPGAAGIPVSMAYRPHTPQKSAPAPTTRMNQISAVVGGLRSLSSRLCKTAHAGKTNETTPNAIVATATPPKMSSSICRPLGQSNGARHHSARAAAALATSFARTFKSTSLSFLMYRHPFPVLCLPSFGSNSEFPSPALSP